jgi:hypothetical protein
MLINTTICCNTTPVNRMNYFFKLKSALDFFEIYETTALISFNTSYA